MKQELLPVFIAVLTSAILQVELIQAYAVVEITYQLIRLTLWFLRSICRKPKQEKSPSNSAKLSGRRRKRR